MGQTDLFKDLDQDLLHTENAPSLDMELDVIATVQRCLRERGFGRDHFLDRINKCLLETGRKVTKNQLNKWLATSQDNTIPAWVLPAMCWALATIEPLSVLLNPLGYKAADNRDDKLKRITELRLEQAQRAREAKTLLQEMDAMMRNNNA